MKENLRFRKEMEEVKRKPLKKAEAFFAVVKCYKNV